MANRVTPLTQIESLTGNISAQTYFDNNISPAFSSLNDSSLGYNNGIASDTGTANNYIVASAFGVASGYNPGMMITFIPANTNTGASTITVDTLASASILDYAGNALIPGAIQSGKVTVIIYISGAFRLMYTSVPQLLFLNQIPTTGGTKTFNCQGAPWVSIDLDATTAPLAATFTIALTNVLPGCHIKAFILPRVGGTQTFKWSGVDTGGNTIGIIATGYPNSTGVNSPVQATVSNLVTTSDSASSFLLYQGAYFKDSGGSGDVSIRFISIFQ